MTLGKSPPGKRQKSFSRARGQNQFVVTQFANLVFRFPQQDACFRLMKDTNAAELYDLTQPAIASSTLLPAGYRLRLQRARSARPG